MPTRLHLKLSARYYVPLKYFDRWDQWHLGYNYPTQLAFT